jgi:argininosuccinate synthase
MSKKKIILAYSGGLDTSIILKWLINKNYEVICLVGDLGQQDDFNKVKKKALALGASKVYIEDMKKEFVENFIFPALKWNALYEGRYLLGTSLARPLISKKQIELAEKENAEYVSHGATGKGNDQVRFELGYYALNSDIKIFSPWKDEDFLKEFNGRSDMINYAEKFNIPIKVSKSKPYSEDENLMHISHEAGILEDPLHIADESVFSKTVSPKKAPNKEIIIEVHFKDGVPIKVVNQNNKKIIKGSLKLFTYLNDLGGKNGIGRLDMVEDRFVGIKSRGIYESPGAEILWKAHRDLEGIAMDREVMHLRDSLMPEFSKIVYNGFWFSPEMDFLMGAVEKSQEAITGKVILSIYKGNVQTIGRYSPTSLYDQKMSSMDIEGGFNALDSKGFIEINAIRLKAHNLIMSKNKSSKK